MDPHDVAAVLAGTVTTQRLAEVLGALRADPLWTVLDPFERAPEWLFQMVYQPTGCPYGFRAERLTPDTWYFEHGLEKGRQEVDAIDVPSGEDTMRPGKLGDWQRKSTDWWVYELRGSHGRHGRHGRQMLFGEVQRHRPYRPSGADWQAIVLGEGVGDDVTLRRQVSFAEATEALEQAAAALAGVPSGPWEDKQATA